MRHSVVGGEILDYRSLDAASKMCFTLQFTSTCLDSYYRAQYL